MWVKVNGLIKILTVVILEIDDDIIHPSKKVRRYLDVGFRNKLNYDWANVQIRRMKNNFSNRIKGKLSFQYLEIGKEQQNTLLDFLSSAAHTIQTFFFFKSVYKICRFCEVIRNRKKKKKKWKKFSSRQNNVINVRVQNFICSTVAFNNYLWITIPIYLGLY